MSPPAVLPSVSCHGVGTLVAIISQLNTLPACAPVNASMAASRLATHDSGSGWLAMPFLCDSFIHYSTPVLSRRTTRAVRADLHLTLDQAATVGGAAASRLGGT
jgi:hypothetical protein